jgi:hypothetical protein
MYNLNYPVEIVSECIHHAQHFGLSLIRYEQKKWHESKVAGHDIYETKSRNPTKNEFAIVAMFPQMWGSTALGFDGIGGAAMTTAYTIVIQSFHSYSREVLVYFDGKFAYRISEPNDIFWEDVKNNCIASVIDCEKYEKKRSVK